MTTQIDGPVDSVGVCARLVAGVEVNFAIALSGAGVASAFVGAAAARDDPWGRKILRAGRAEGVEMRGTTVDAGHPTGLLFKEFIDDPGIARVHYRSKESAASRFASSEGLTQAAHPAPAVHTTSISWVVSTSLRSAREVAYKSACAGALRTFDGNIGWRPDPARGA